MNCCWNCGHDVADDAKFCDSCGADLTRTQTPPAGGVGGGPKANNELILKIFAGVFAGVFAIYLLLGLGNLFQNIWYFARIFGELFSGYFDFFWFLDGILSLALNILSLLSYVWLLAAMLLLAIKRTPENSDGLLVLAIGGVAVRGIVDVISLVVRFILNLRYFDVDMMAPYLLRSMGGIVLRLLIAAAAAVGAYLIIRLVIGESPLAGKDFNTLLAEGKVALLNLKSSVVDAADQARANHQAAQAAQAASAPSTAPYAAPSAGRAPAPVSYGAACHMSTNRSLLVYILLNIVTCGIYGMYFVYSIARDMNIVCAGDGKQTAGLLKFFLLNLITCNIYSWVWYYSLGNRMAATAPRYNLSFQENGTTILLWMLLGSLLCGIGPFIALHILMKNANALCGAYNARNGV